MHVGGDDNITFDVKRESMIKAAEMVGQDFETSTVPFGKPFSFLSRKFTKDIWTGDLASHCDVIRTVSKFNLTSRLPDNVTPTEKLIEKSMAYYKTDRNTPVIGDIVCRVHDLTNGFKGIEKSKHHDSIVNFFSKYDEEVQFNNLLNTDHLGEIYQLIEPFFDYTGFALHVSSCKTLDDILALPMFDNRTIDPPKETNLIITTNNDEFFSTLDTSMIPEIPKFNKEINAHSATRAPNSKPSCSTTQTTSTNTKPTKIKMVQTFDTETTENPFKSTTENTTNTTPAHSPPNQLKIEKIKPQTTNPTALNVTTLTRISNPNHSDKFYHFNKCFEKAKLQPSNKQHVIVDVGSGNCQTLLAYKALFPDAYYITIDPTNKHPIFPWIKEHYTNIRQYIVKTTRACSIMIFSSVLHHIPRDADIISLLESKFTDDAMIYVRDHDARPDRIESLRNLHKKHYQDATDTNYKARATILEMFDKFGGWQTISSSNQPQNLNTMHLFQVLLTRKSKF